MNKIQEIAIQQEGCSIEKCTTIYEQYKFVEGFIAGVDVALKNPELFISEQDGRIRHIDPECPIAIGGGFEK